MDILQNMFSDRNDKGVACQRWGVSTNPISVLTGLAVFFPELTLK
jgi:hypothetical protein